jgi:hypothetical protein
MKTSLFPKRRFWLSLGGVAALAAFLGANAAQATFGVTGWLGMVGVVLVLGLVGFGAWHFRTRVAGDFLPRGGTFYLGVFWAALGGAYLSLYGQPDGTWLHLLIAALWLALGAARLLFIPAEVAQHHRIEELRRQTEQLHRKIQQELEAMERGGRGRMTQQLPNKDKPHPPSRLDGLLKDIRAEQEDQNKDTPK